MKKRSGCIYSEETNPGLHSPIVAKGVGLIPRKFRWVGEITIHGRRYRFRSTNYNNVQFWVDMMVQRYKNEP